MVLKPAWDGNGFAAMSNNGLVALSHTDTNAHQSENKKSELFYVHPNQSPTPTDYKGLASYTDGVDEIPMQTRRKTIVQTKKRPATVETKQTTELRDSRTRTPSSRRSSRRERKMELEQDIEKLRKKLRYEENVHRALERAFTRPLGALPRFPPYLSPKTLELLAEVAVLEEEVARLEEQIVNLRQGLYQEAVNISSSKKQLDPIENTEQSKAQKPEHLKSPSWDPRSVEENQQVKKGFVVGGMLPSINESLSNVASQSGSVNRKKASSGCGSEPQVTHFAVQVENSKQPLFKSHTEEATISFKGLQKSSTPSEAGHGKENQQHANPRIMVSSSYVSRLRTVAQKQHPIDNKDVKTNAPKAKNEHNTITCKLQPECMPSLNALEDGENMDPNRLSEEMLKCLLSIFSKLTRHSSGSEYDTSSVVSRSTLSSRRFGTRSNLNCKLLLDSSEETAFRDPYGVCVDSETRDVGPYKYMHETAASSIDWGRIQHCSPFLKRLKVLVNRLSSVDLKGLTHQQKLAFWINMYNVCMMNAFLEHGIPGNSQMIVALMRKAVINVGGHLLNALTIEHFILRLPYHSKDAYPKGGKKDREATMRSVYGLEWPEPLVTFALSCGSWSSPAVRVYTAAEVENELETAKKEYLQAAIGITSKKQLLLPKLLDWYLRDFAKDAESLLDWICLQLPSSLRNAVVECMERGRKEQVIQVMPYEFDFRYLFAT